MSASESRIGGSLTPRETEIARLVASGMRNRAIAEALRITEVTVKNHLQRIMRKLEAENRTHVALWVIGRETRA